MKPEQLTSFRLNVKSRNRCHDTSMRQMAELLGIHQDTWRAWETGERNPPANLAQRLLELMTGSPLSQNKEHVKPSRPDENESQLEKPLPENPETVNTSKDHASFKERERAAVNKWRSNNRAKYNEYMREYRRKRRHDNN